VVRVGPGSAPASNPFILPPNTTGTDMIRSNGRFGAHHVRIGMGYRF
jgi:outer membrane immunogenic protein